MTSPMSGQPGDLKQSTRRALPYSAMVGLLQIVFSLAGLLLLVRYLPPNSYGLWMILLGLATPVLLSLSVGHLQALIRFMPALESLEDRRDLLWRVAARRTFAAAVAFSVLILAFPLFGERFGIAGQRPVFVILVPGFIAMAANEYLVAALNVAFRQREVLIGAFVQQAGFVSGLIWGIVHDEGVIFFALAYSIAVGAQLTVNILSCVRHYGPPRLSDWARLPDERPERRRYRLTSYVDDLGTMLLSSQVNRLLLAVIATTGQVALFAVASNVVDRLVALQPLQVFRPLATVSLFSRYEQSGSVEDVNRMFHFIYGVNRSATMLYLVLFLPLGRDVLAIVFRPEYAEAYVPTLLLLIALAIFSMPVGMVAQALKRPQALVWAKAALFLNIGIGIPLAISFGAAGMALAAALSMLVKNVITYVVLRLEFAVRYPWRMLVRYLAAGSVATISIEALQMVVPIFVAGALGIIVYAVSLRVFAVLDHSERALLVSLLPSRVQPIVRTLLG